MKHNHKHSVSTNPDTRSAPLLATIAQLRRPLAYRLALELEELRHGMVQMTEAANDRISFAVHDYGIFTIAERSQTDRILEVMSNMAHDIDALLEELGHPHEEEAAF